MDRKKKIIIIASIIVAFILLVVLLLVLFPLGKKSTEEDKSQDISSQEEYLYPSGEESSENGDTNQGGEYTSEDTAFLRKDLGENNIDFMNDQLPYYTDDFAIEYDTENRIYTIKLFAIYNYERQYDQYIESLKQYKQDALEWISEQGVNIYDINIEYLPEEAEDL